MKRTDVANPIIFFAKGTEQRVDPVFLSEILEKLPKDSKADVFLFGSLLFLDEEEKTIDINVNGNLWSVGGIFDQRINLNVKGDVHFDVAGCTQEIGHFNVGGDVFNFRGEIKTKSFIVNGSCITYGCDIISPKITVGGDFIFGPCLPGSVRSETIEVGGDFVCPQTVICPSIRVLGDIECIAKYDEGFAKAIRDITRQHNIVQCNRIIVQGYRWYEEGEKRDWVLCNDTKLIVGREVLFRK